MTDPQQPLSRRAAREAGQPTTTKPPRSPSGSGSSMSPRRVGLIAGAMALAFVLLGTGAVFAGIAAGTPKGSAAPNPTSSATPTRAVPSDQLTAAGIPTCSIGALASAPALMKTYGSVVSASGSPVYALNDTVPQAPASVVKVLTAAAALSVLGPTFQITTQVVDDAQQPGSVVLVGEGDPTLSATGQSVYAGAPTMASLAQQTLTAYQAAHPGQQITKVILDSSYWDPTDNWDPSWPATERTKGYQSEVTALQVDGDRANPQQEVSPRGTDPVMTAGKAFVSALGLSGVTLVTGDAENGAPQLAAVKSQPVSTLVKQMLLNDDNTLGEMLARIVSVKENLGGSSLSLQNAIPTALAKYGVSTAGLTVVDGSGESPKNGIPALFMAKFMAAVSQGQNNLQYVQAGMSLAGKSGSLASRFTGANAVAAGKVYGRSGFIATAYTLSGYLTAKDGTTLAFAFYAVGTGITSAAQPALDTLATGVYNCGKNLAGN